MNQVESPLDENTPTLSQKDENVSNQQPRQSLPLGEKDDNIREALRQKLDFKNSGTHNIHKSSLKISSLENSPHKYVPLLKEE